MNREMSEKGFVLNTKCIIICNRIRVRHAFNIRREIVNINHKLNTIKMYKIEINSIPEELNQN